MARRQFEDAVLTAYKHELALHPQPVIESLPLGAVAAAASPAVMG